MLNKTPESFQSTSPACSTQVLETEKQSPAAESYFSAISNLVKSSGIYAISSLASPLISLLLTPFLTRSLSGADYGALAVLNTVIALLAGVTQLGLNAAFLRTYNFSYESMRDRLNVLSTLVITLFLMTIPVSIIVLLTAPSLSFLLLNSSSFSSSLQITAIVILIQNLAQPGLLWLHAENRSVLFTFASIANLLISAIATIIFVGVWHMGITGALLATGSGYAATMLCTLPLVVIRAGLRFHLPIAWEMATFGAPHVMNLMSSWILQVSDRYLLSHFTSLSETAHYSVGYSLGSLLSPIIIAPFSLAWWTLLYSLAKRNDAQKIFKDIFRWFSILLLFGTFGLSLIGVIGLDTFFPTSYHSAASIIPIITVSTMFNGIFVVVSLGASLQKKSWISTISIVISALLNFGLNLILIPRYGAMGAAITTCIAYIVLAVVAYFINQHIYPVSFEIGVFIIALLIGIALYAGSGVVAQNQELYIGWSIRFGALLLYGVCLLMLGVQSIQKAHEYIAMIKHIPIFRRGTSNENTYIS
jgi:O-antigen/teichoic acid export membrane protein